MKTAEIIKELRRLSGNTRASFARRYGIPQRTLENWEGEVNDPPAYVVDLLARAVVTDLTGRPAEFRVVSTKIGTSGEPDGDQFDVSKVKNITDAIADAEDDRQRSAGNYQTEIRIYSEDIDDDACETFDYYTFNF